MKTQKFWVFLCLVFAFQSLDVLFEESYEVVYEKSNKTKPIQYLICEKLIDLYPNETEIDLEKLPGDLYNRFKSFSYGWRRSNLGGFEEFVRNQTKPGRYLVLNRKVCLIAKDVKELGKIFWILYPSPKMIKSYFAVSRDTFDLLQISRWNHHIEQLTVLKKGHPYSDCSRSNARFHCLNECFKKSFRISRYLYEGNESGRISLDYSKTNRSIEENEKSCFGSCKRENCKMVQLISNHVSAIESLERPKVEIFKAHRKLSVFDYWVQMIGLLCSFAGLSLNEFASVVIEFGQSKVKRKKVKIALFCLKLAIFLLGLASFGYLCSRVALDHKAAEENPKEKEGTRHLVQPKTVHLAICVSIVEIKDGTMLEIEKATDGKLDDALESIYLNYLDRSFPIDYHVYPKVLFFSFQRCFLLSVHLNYQMQLFNPKLTIRFNDEDSFFFPDVYLLSENENLNYKSFKYSGEHAFQKRMVKRLRGRCVDYKEKFENCTGRQNCVERCISRKFIERFNKTTWYSQVIDRDWFSPTEWNTFKLMEIPDNNPSIFERIRGECLKEIPDEKACEEAEFKEAFEIPQPDAQTMEIDLQFNVVRSVEEESSWYKLAYDLLNIQSIIFGLSALGILQMIASLIQATLRLGSNKHVFFFLYLLCSLGAIWHTYHILHLVIKGELVPTSYYELVKRVQMPKIIFCLNYDTSSIDENHQLTGDYLAELTSQMTAESTFKSITYLNESNEWVPFSLNRVKRFFLFSMKCFRIDIDEEYDRDQFHFSKESQVLKVHFIKTTTDNRGNIVRFMTKSKVSAEFSKIVDLDFSSFWIYSITQETSLYKYEDRFSFIRSHFTSFQEDEASDLQRQLFELQSSEPNRRTLNMPLKEEAFGLEVDEDLFEQLYYSSVQKGKKKQTNYQQLFVDNHLRMTSDRTLSKPEFIFNSVFLQKVVSSTNEDNLGQLILNLLNVLFIWFDLDVFDLYAHLHLPLLFFNKINQFLLSSFRWLKKFESPLSEQLKPRNQQTRRVHPEL